MISHTYLATGDLEQAVRFYRPLLAELGWKMRFLEPELAKAGWSPAGGGRPLFVLGGTYDGRPPDPGNGVMVALLAQDRATVDRVHEMAVGSGARSEGAPGLRPHYHPHFYGAYFRDPTGHKLCVCTHAPGGEPPAAPGRRLGRSEMLQLAEAWIAAWNRKDVGAVLAGFAPEATFHSPYVRRITGQESLSGRDAIGAYWRAALETIGQLHFTLLGVVCDEPAQSMVVSYEAELDGERRRACERFRFRDGAKIEAEALYGDLI